MGAAINVAIDNTAQNVYADGPKPSSTVTATRTPTATVTPTPDVQDIKIAIADKTTTALSKERDLAFREATHTAIADEISAIKGTPTKTSIPTLTPTPTETGTPTVTSTVTPTFTEEQIRIRQRAGLFPTYTPVPSPTATFISEKLENRDNSELPLGQIIIGSGLIGLIASIYAFRYKIPWVKNIGTHIPGPHF